MGHLSRGNPGCMEKRGNERLENSPTERDVGFLVDGKLKMSHQCALVAQRASCVLGCIEEGDGPALLCADAASPRVWGQVWGPQFKKDLKL